MEANPPNLTLDTEIKKPFKNKLAISIFFIAIILLGGYFLWANNTIETPNEKIPEIKEEISTIATEEKQKFYQTVNDQVQFMGFPVAGFDGVGGSKVPDPKTFEEIGDGWGKDKDSLYFEMYAFASLSTNSLGFSGFKLLSNKYACDDNAVVYYVNTQLGQSNPIWTGKIYHLPIGENCSVFRVEGIYGVGAQGVYIGYDKIEGVDQNTFKLLSNDLFKDASYVYKGKNRISADYLDVSSVEVIGDMLKDNNNLYSIAWENNGENKAVLVKDISLVGFKFINRCSFAEKSHAFYYKNDTNVFVYSDQFTDEGRVVGTLTPIDADSASFEFLVNLTGDIHGSSYAKDKDNIYYGCGRKVEKAHPETFIYLGRGYAKYNNAVWFWNNVIEGADPETFIVAKSDVYAKDKNYVYYEGRQIDADAESLVVVHRVSRVWGDRTFGISFAKDKNNVYFLGEVLEGVNPVDCTADAIENCEGPVGTLEIISPGVGEVWKIGSTYKIEWSWSGLPGDRVTIRLLREQTYDGQYRFSHYLANVPAVDKSYDLVLNPEDPRFSSYSSGGSLFPGNYKINISSGSMSRQINDTSESVIIVE